VSDKLLYGSAMNDFKKVGLFASMDHYEEPVHPYS